MSRIRGRDTKPEIALRKSLHGRGFRYRKNARELPGKPDLVFPRYRAIVLVHGCFWHRHLDCRLSTTPTTNVDFWVEKFQRTVERDRKVLNEPVREGVEGCNSLAMRIGKAGIEPYLYSNRRMAQNR